jgi:aconitase A
VLNCFRADAQQKNENLEFERNKERFTFLKVLNELIHINNLINKKFN